jgi:hypothetical protein
MDRKRRQDLLQQNVSDQKHVTEDRFRDVRTLWRPALPSKTPIINTNIHFTKGVPDNATALGAIEDSVDSNPY